ncbi:hypothetical protein BDN70DRAFT_490644 [Pholiota conissans]|uniref:Secreted protein n=1 Tax=Pholiota conissans TaxID=109636 RepID=A0A9P5YQU7_9AGAR|nr:hypothetical protein BDN70DRAFT_490644 [Pholiota conissans]
MAISLLLPLFLRVTCEDLTRAKGGESSRPTTRIVEALRSKMVAGVGGTRWVFHLRVYILLPSVRPSSADDMM